MKVIAIIVTLMVSSTLALANGKLAAQSATRLAEQLAELSRTNKSVAETLSKAGINASSLSKAALVEALTAATLTAESLAVLKSLSPTIAKELEGVQPATSLSDELAAELGQVSGDASVGAVADMASVRAERAKVRGMGVDGAAFGPSARDVLAANDQIAEMAKVRGIKGVEAGLLDTEGLKCLDGNSARVTDPRAKANLGKVVIKTASIMHTSPISAVDTLGELRGLVRARHVEDIGQSEAEAAQAVDTLSDPRKCQIYAEAI